MNLQTDHTRMFGQRKDCPITKMFIKRYKNSVLSNGLFQYFIVIRSRLSDFGGTHHIVASIAQSLSYIQLQHLIQI